MRSLILAAAAVVLLAVTLLTPAPMPVVTTVHPAPTHQERIEAVENALARLTVRYGSYAQAPEGVQRGWWELVMAREALLVEGPAAWESAPPTTTGPSTSLQDTPQ